MIAYVQLWKTCFRGVKALYLVERRVRPGLVRVWPVLRTWCYTASRCKGS